MSEQIRIVIDFDMETAGNGIYFYKPHYVTEISASQALHAEVSTPSFDARVTSAFAEMLRLKVGTNDPQREKTLCDAVLKGLKDVFPNRSFDVNLQEGSPRYKSFDQTGGELIFTCTAHTLLPRF